MSNDQPSPDKPTSVSSQVSEWMTGKSSDGRAELAYYEPELAVAYAAFAEYFPAKIRFKRDGTIIDPADDERAYLFQLLTAIWFSDVHTLPDWQTQIADYPEKSLKDMQLPGIISPATKVRSHYLNNALVKLLELVGAPRAAVDDIDYILKLHKPQSADVRAEAQQKLNETPDASARAISRKMSRRIKQDGKEIMRDHKQISEDINEGRIVRPKAPEMP